MGEHTNKKKLIRLLGLLVADVIVINAAAFLALLSPL